MKKKKTIAVLCLSFQQYKVHAFNIIRSLEHQYKEDFIYKKDGSWEGHNYRVMPITTYRAALGLDRETWEDLIYCGEWFKNREANAIQDRFAYVKGRGGEYAITHIIQENEYRKNSNVEDVDRRVADKIRERSGRREESPVRGLNYGRKEHWQG